jgi:hypothetical protein
MLDSSVESGQGDEEEENSGRDDSADNVETRHHVRRLAVRRDADQKKRDHLEIKTMVV